MDSIFTKEHSLAVNVFMNFTKFQKLMKKYTSAEKVSSRKSVNLHSKVANVNSFVICGGIFEQYIMIKW
jgi:hypothetical protein